MRAKCYVVLYIYSGTACVRPHVPGGELVPCSTEGLLERNNVLRARIHPFSKKEKEREKERETERERDRERQRERERERETH